MQIIRSNNSTIGKFGVADSFRGKSRAAFTMVELAVVLVIIALMMGQFIKFSIEGQKTLKDQVTKEKIAFIMQAIEDYAKENERLPCPADGSLSLNDPDYGLQNLDALGSDCSDVRTSAGKKFLAGVLPIHELNINLKYMTDGWGRKFSYIIDYEVSGSNSLDSTAGIEEGDIVVKHIQSSTVDVNSTDKASVVVISHGENGYRAWNARGSSQHKIRDLLYDDAYLQIENTGSSRFFIQNFLLPDGKNALFDDIVEYRESYQLVNW